MPLLLLNCGYVYYVETPLSQSVLRFTPAAETSSYGRSRTRIGQVMLEDMHNCQLTTHALCYFVGNYSRSRHE